MPADYKCKVMQLYEQWSRSGNLMKRSNGKLEGPKNLILKIHLFTKRFQANKN